jgi:nucleotide-binding universal stress UspA family protein
MRVLISTIGLQQTDIGIRQLIRLAESVPIEPTVLMIIKYPEERNEADAALAQVAALLDPVFEKVQYKVRIGQSWEEIVKEGEAGHYDLLIMGQRASRPLLARLRGHVTQKVVTHTSLPVLIAQREAIPLKRILICDSGVQSPTLLQLFYTRLPGILTQAADITVLHVMSQILAAPGIEERDLQASAEELIQAHTPEGVFLTQDLTYLEKLGLNTGVKVRHGLVIDEISDEARNGNYNLVVIGAHRGNQVPRFLLDDLSRELVLDIERPILIVR